MGWRRHLSAAVVGLFFLCPVPARSAPPETARYVGSQVCAGCHQAQYQSYMQNSKKAHSSKSLRLMAKGLTQEEQATCFACHTTGYGRPGGFTGFEATPHLADAGCEVCHGPGSIHADSGDPASIKGKLSLADCQGCHNASRVRAFNFKPLLFGGAH